MEDHLSTQKYQILEHLKRHGHITAIEALNEYGCFRLAARIAELRETYQIKTLMVFKSGKRYAKYMYYSEAA